MNTEFRMFVALCEVFLMYLAGKTEVHWHVTFRIASLFGQDLIPRQPDHKAAVTLVHL